jgi:hypothetical protein
MFEKDGFKLEKFVHKKLPLLAKAKSKLKKCDQKLVEYFANDDWKKFDGVVFVPEKREVFCSFYDEFNKVAVLIPLTDLNFQNIEVQKRVTKFRKKYHYFK